MNAMLIDLMLIFFERSCNKLLQDLIFFIWLRSLPLLSYTYIHIHIYIYKLYININRYFKWTLSIFNFLFVFSLTFASSFSLFLSLSHNLVCVEKKERLDKVNAELRRTIVESMEFPSFSTRLLSCFKWENMRES